MVIEGFETSNEMYVFLYLQGGIEGKVAIQNRNSRFIGIVYINLNDQWAPLSYDCVYDTASVFGAVCRSFGLTSFR